MKVCQMKKNRKINKINNNFHQTVLGVEIHHLHDVWNFETLSGLDEWLWDPWGVITWLQEFVKTFQATQTLFALKTELFWLLLYLNVYMSRNQLWNCTHFRHPTEEQLRHVDIYFLATIIICSLSTLNYHNEALLGWGQVHLFLVWISNMVISHFEEYGHVPVGI